MNQDITPVLLIMADRSLFKNFACNTAEYDFFQETIGFYYFTFELGKRGENII